MPWTTSNNTKEIHNPQHKSLIELTFQNSIFYRLSQDTIESNKLKDTPFIAFNSQNKNKYSPHKDTQICGLNIPMIGFAEQLNNFIYSSKKHSVVRLTIPMIKFADQLNNFIFCTKERSIAHLTFPFDFHPGAFRDSDISSVVIPKSCKKIHPYAFYNTKLTEVTIARDCEYDETSFPDGCIINFYD